MTTTTQKQAKHSNGYSAFDFGDFGDLDDYKFRHPLIGREVSGKVFLKEVLNLTGMQVSFGRLRPGAAVPFLHTHKQNEELYIFISGRGQMLVNGDVIEVSEGSAVRIEPSATRTWRNTGDTELVTIVIQAKEGSLIQDTLDDGEPVTKPPVWPV